MAVSYAQGVLVSKSLTLPKGVHDGFLPVTKNTYTTSSHHYAVTAIAEPGCYLLFWCCTLISATEMV